MSTIIEYRRSRAGLPPIPRQSAGFTRARIGLTRVTVVWRRELGVFAVNWTDILDGEIVNAAWAVAGMVAKPRTARRVAASLDTAAWADTERLIRDALAEIPAHHGMPDLSEEEIAELAAALKRHEVQGALQALLAVRLTSAPETDAIPAREALRLALRSVSPLHDLRTLAEDALRPGARLAPPVTPGNSAASDLNPLASWLSEYFDDKISVLVGTLEGRVGFESLAQVRAEAFSSRLVAGNSRIEALLASIERLVTALADPNRRSQAESEFLTRYRRQARQRHGFLTLPDFDRRLRVHANVIYVPSGIIHLPAGAKEEDYSERVRPMTPGSKTVWDLVELLDRTVLLGDPGGGKSTAANVLTDYFAGDTARKIPFLVTLREYAASTPIEWSVVEHIEHNLRTVYQSNAPEGLVERLLSTGRALVIFDGLDELLDTSHRLAVSDRVEQFCFAYPLAPVLVTSRVVGYNQARLDDTQFICYRLGGFGDAEVAEYALKWFTSQEGSAAAAAKAKAFLTESANAEDLRANPLLLSLMCILYRGTESLPSDRAGIYARCTELLLRKWDQWRDLYRKLKWDHLVELTLSYLAWWLFTQEDNRASATERELISKTAEFVYGRGFETEDEAQAAAREFIEFCRGRMWVFSDAGTTADGERLYAFTHRTFMEYFAAWHLAATSDTPEALAQRIVEHAGSGAWTLVVELAMQIKAQGTDRGADRIYSFLLDQETDEPFVWSRLLGFLTDCLASTRPSPATARRLAGSIIDHTLRNWDNRDITVPMRYALVEASAPYRPTISDELGRRIAELTASPDGPTRVLALELLLSIAERAANEFFDAWAKEQISHYAPQIRVEATASTDFRRIALYAREIPLSEALEMPGGPSAIVNWLEWQVYDRIVERHILNEDSVPVKDTTGQLASIGRYLARHPAPPWICSHSDRVRALTMAQVASALDNLKSLDEFSGLGFAAVFAMWNEISRIRRPRPDLSGIPMPGEFKGMFRDWAAGQVSFVEILEE